MEYYLLVLLSLISCCLAAYTPMKITIPEDGGTLRIFSTDDLAIYDGSNPGEPIYMAVKGVVFDVSTGEDFYGKDAPYNALVGKDASRAVAKMSLEPEDLNDDLSGLSDGFLKALDDIYSQTYLPKYPIVGYMESLLDETERRLLYDEL